MTTMNSKKWKPKSRNRKNDATLKSDRLNPTETTPVSSVPR